MNNCIKNIHILANRKYSKRVVIILISILTVIQMSAMDKDVESSITDSISSNKKSKEAISRNLFVELGGPSLGIGIGYDQRFEPNSIFGFSAGLAYINGSADNGGSWGGSISSEYRYIEFKGVTLPLELNAILGKRASKFELGLGATPCILKRSEYMSRYYGSERETEGTKLNIFGTMNIGYRLQRKSGFFLRAGLTFLIGDIHCSPFDGLLCVPNLSLGYTFQQRDL